MTKIIKSTLNCQFLLFYLHSLIINTMSYDFYRRYLDFFHKPVFVEVIVIVISRVSLPSSL